MSKTDEELAIKLRMRAALILKTAAEDIESGYRGMFNKHVRNAEELLKAADILADYATQYELVQS